MWPESGNERLTPAQLAVLERAVRGKQVVDLGAGVWASLSALCARLGARLVTAVEKQDFEADRSVMIALGVRLYQGEIQDFMRTLDGQDIDVALISWPWLSMAPISIERLLERCRTVVYIGKNTSDVRCGSGKNVAHAAFWQHLTKRAIVETEPDPIQVVTVYGPPYSSPVDRALIEEERAALSVDVVRYTGGV